MIIDDSHYDVIVIGSGAAGATIASDLGQRGHRVLLLERGGPMPLVDQNVADVDLFRKDRYHPAEQWFGTDGDPFSPQTIYAFGGNTKIWAAVLERLRAIGVRLSIDDFGTGYSSLAYLTSLPISELKIDGSFVRGLGVAARSAAVATAIIALGRSLGLEVVAEGVETRAQVVCLKLAGCDVAQGYHFSRPLSLQQLRDYSPFINSVENTCVQ